MYCKHCHKFINGAPERCPYCGKRQTDSLLKRVFIFILRFYRGCLFATLFEVLFALIGSALQIDKAGDIIYAIFSLLTAVGSIAIAIILELRIGGKKKPTPPVSVDITPIKSDRHLRTPFHDPDKKEADAIPHIQETPTPAPVQEASVLSSDTDRSARIKAEAGAIVQRMREATIAQIQAERDTISSPSVDEIPAADNPHIKVVPPSKVKSFTARATAMEPYMNNIMELAFENLDYNLSKYKIIDKGLEDEKIWKYDFYPSKAELVPEPDNPVDKNAIKFVVDGLQVGYIKAHSCVKILNKLKAGKIRGISCEMGGGPYKIVTEDYDDDSYIVEHDAAKYFVHLTIYESTEE